MLLGCIADDFTGATDLANTLSQRGMHTVQLIGVPQGPVPEADAVVVALKSRTIPAKEAVSLSLEACRWLLSQGAAQIYFKYCSTFDSTDQGNIGPVADALLQELGADFTIACPAFPENGRTIYLGHLFVGDLLLSDSGMRNHPLTPMTDANLVRVLQRQTPASVGLVPYKEVRKGAAGIAACFAQLRSKGVRHAIVDAVEDRDLLELGTACAGLKLVTGGSGAALGLPENFRKSGQLASRAKNPALPTAGGMSAVLSGSCSQATLQQVDVMKRRFPARLLHPKELAGGTDQVVADTLKWARQHLENGPVLIYASAPPEQVSAIQAELGRERSGALVEDALARIARDLVTAGVRRLVIAGGETSGAVVKALDVKALEIGPQIDPGVPATLSIGTPRIALALKSGNFGGPEFFEKALEHLK